MDPCLAFDSITCNKAMYCMSSCFLKGCIEYAATRCLYQIDSGRKIGLKESLQDRQMQWQFGCHGSKQRQAAASLLQNGFVTVQKRHIHQCNRQQPTHDATRVADFHNYIHAYIITAVQLHVNAYKFVVKYAISQAGMIPR